MARKPTGKMMKAIIENLADAAIGIDKEGKIVFCNNQAIELLEDIEGNPMNKMIWDVMEINDFVRTFTHMVKEPDPSPLEQLLPFYGKYIFLVKMIPVRGGDNRVMGAIAIMRDMTDIHKMEMAVNEFVAKVSHELKTPLTSIKGFVETLLEGALNNPEVTRRFLQVINEETNRLTRLVINLLDLTRMMHANGQEPPIGPVDTTLFIREAVKLFEPIAREKGITLVSSIADELPTIHISADKLRQVLINLVDNAMKYTGVKGGGGNVEVRAVANGSSIQVEVIDSGIGIESEEQRKIFEKFYRVTTGPASQLGGTGLGLSITQEIVQAHGGKISVQSAPGEGSVFTFTVPYAPKEG